MEAKARGDRLAKCHHCQTTNPVGTYLQFRDADVCRGCGRPLPDAYPTEYFESQVDSVYRRVVRFRRFAFWQYVVPIGLFGAVAILDVIPEHSRSRATDQALLSAAAVFVISTFVAPKLVRWFLTWRGRLRSPETGHLLRWWDWETAGDRYKHWKNEVLAKTGWMGVIRDWAEHAGLLLAMLPVILGMLGFHLYTHHRMAQKHQQDLNAAMTGVIKVSLRPTEGGLELVLTNDSTHQFGSSDLKVAIHLTNGQRPLLERYWTTWNPKEAKTIPIPNDGQVERVDLSGTITIPSHRISGQIAGSYTFNSPPALPGKP